MRMTGFIKTMLASAFILSVIAIPTAHSGVCDTVRDGLIACYPLDGNVNDESGNGNNGTVSGGVSYADGVAGKAIQLDGVNGYVNVGHSAILDVNYHTISAWINYNPNGGYYQNIVGKVKPGVYESITFQISNRSLTTGFATDAEISHILTSSNVLSSGWHFVAMTYDGSYIRFYVDGIIDSEFQRSGTVRTNTDDLAIGRLAKKLGIQPSVNIEESETGENRKQGWERKTSKISECFPNLVMMKKGGFDKGGGTWIHYKLGVPLAQWLSPEFALVVSDWVEEWLKTGRSPIKEEDLDRIQSRKQLRNEHRLYLTDTIKEHLELIGQYHPASKETRYKFAVIHDEINQIITGETAKEMRNRTGLEAKELLRDYFPLDKLTYYSALTISAANAMKEGNDPLKAVHLAAKRVLPNYFKAEPIQLIEPIRELERKVFAQLVGQNNNQIALPAP